MTLEEIRSHCQSQINLKACPVGKVEAGFLLPGSWGKRNTRRLWPGGPKGRIIQEFSNGYIYVMFNAKEVIEAINDL